MGSLLLFLALLLGCLGLWLLLRAGKARRDSGLPSGRVTYIDTVALVRCERPLFSDRYRLTGRPDYLVQSRRDLIPVEVKSGTAPSQPYVAHLLQLAAYCLLVEEQEGRAPPHGILKYADKAFKVGYTPALRKELADTMASLRSREVDRSHDEPRRCLGCGYRADCDQSLA